MVQQPPISRCARAGASVRASKRTPALCRRRRVQLEGWRAARASGRAGAGLREGLSAELRHQEVEVRRHDRGLRPPAARAHAHARVARRRDRPRGPRRRGRQCEVLAPWPGGRSGELPMGAAARSRPSRARTPAPTAGCSACARARAASARPCAQGGDAARAARAPAPPRRSARSLRGACVCRVAHLCGEATVGGTVGRTVGGRGGGFGPRRRRRHRLRVAREAEPAMAALRRNLPRAGFGRACGTPRAASRATMCVQTC